MLSGEQRSELLKCVGELGRGGGKARAGGLMALVDSLIHTAERKALAQCSGLYQELDTLGRYIRKARADVVAIRPQDIQNDHLQTASDELDAVVQATEVATGLIMDAAERINERASGLGATEIADDVIKIFEACSFQDITGQRISKVVNALKHVEDKVNALINAFGDELKDAAAAPADTPALDGEAALLNGPQLPGAGINQADIDALLAR